MTFVRFYEAMTAVRDGKTEYLPQALSCLYLEKIEPDKRDARGADLADRLFTLMDVTTFNPDTLQEEPETDEYTISLTVGNDDTPVEIVMRKREGIWQFDYDASVEQVEQSAEQVQLEAAEVSEATAEFLPGMGSPRETMKTFLTSMNAKRIAEAAATLDLSELPATVRRTRGAELAVQLKKILDRHAYVNLTKLPHQTEGVENYVYMTDIHGSIALAVVVENEESGVKAWKFSSDTVAGIHELYQAFKDRPLAEGVHVDDVPMPYSLLVRDSLASAFPVLLMRTFGVENYDWFALFLTILVGMVFSRVAAYLSLLLVRRVFRSEDFTIDRSDEKNFVRSVRVGLMTWVWIFGLGRLDLPAKALTLLTNTAVVVTVVAGVWATYSLVDILGRFLLSRAARTDTKFDDLLAPLISRSLKIFTIAVGAVILAQAFDINLAGLIAGLGLGGLALALAAQDTARNFFGSLTILLDRPFQIGDWIQIGNVDGNVEWVGIRSTRVRTFYNSLITVPNSEVTTVAIDNYGARRFRRIKMTIGIAYDTPPESVEAFCEGIRHLIRVHPYTRKDYYHVYLNGFGDSALEILLYCFVETPEWGTELRERHRLLVDIMRLAKELGIEFAFPTRTLYMREETTPDKQGSAPPDPDTAFRQGRSEASRLADPKWKESRPEPVDYRLPKDAGELGDGGDGQGH